MKQIILSLIALWALLPVVALAQAEPGKPAPNFSVADASGKTHTLADFKGKWVVLEWFNKDCPYVKKHYGSQNMQKLQANYTAKGVQWLTVISSKKGKQGYLEPQDALDLVKKDGIKASAILLDTDSAMGKAFDAKVTPHMYIINPDGLIVYNGAIDDNDSSNPKVIAKSKNYVSAALDSAMAGKPVEVASSRAYGCSVKY